jgi:nitrogen regulatory protein P-II 1
MKLIEAVINKLKLQDVCNALDEMGVEDYTESAIICHGHQQGHVMTFRGATFVANIIEKVKLEIIAADDSVNSIIEAISFIAKTESRDDCRIALRLYVEVA